MYFRLHDRDVFASMQARGHGEPCLYLYKDAKNNTHLRIFGLYAVFSRKT